MRAQTKILTHNLKQQTKIFNTQFELANIFLVPVCIYKEKLKKKNNTKYTFDTNIYLFNMENSIYK